MASQYRPATIQERILVVAADPMSTSLDFVEEEVLAIRGAFGESRGVTTTVSAAKTANQEQLANTISEFRPSIVHLTGHGSPSGRVIFEDQSGWLRNLTGVTVARIVAHLTPRLQCIVLSGCRVSRELPFLRFVADKVISVSSRSDGVDITPVVTKSLYQSIGQGTGYRDAFNMVKSKLDELELVESVHTNFYQGAKPSTDVLQRLLPGDLEMTGLIEPESTYFERMRLLSSFLSSRKAPKLRMPSPGRAMVVEPEGEEEDRGPRIHRVWFGTNRKPINISDPEKGFGAKRSEHVHYGYYDVSVPKYHVIGSIGDPWWSRFPKFWQNNHLAVYKRRSMAEDEYWRSIRTVFDGLTESDRVLLIFIHGYNVNFDQAVVRAAQLGFDLGIRGATGLFSWPSKGGIAGYLADSAAIDASEEMLGDFIKNMANRSGAADVHVIAHSMGNRGLLRAFASVVGRISSSIDVPLKQIFLAAPDVDVDLFQRLATAYAKVAERTTMYVSGKDKALWSSGIVHDYPRAGYTPPVTVVNGIDTVEVTNIDLNFLGHGYFAEAGSVLRDMHSLMAENLAPSHRTGLEECVTSSSDVYWKMKP